MRIFGLAQALQSPKPEHPWLSKRARALRSSHDSASPHAVSWKRTTWCKDAGNAMHVSYLSPAWRHAAVIVCLQPDD